LQLPEDPNSGEILCDLSQVNPQLAEVLDKMVHYQISERYQSADEALQAVQGLTTIPLTEPPTVLPPPKYASVASFNRT